MKNKSLKWNVAFNMMKSIMHIIFPLISFPYASRILGVDNIGKVQYCTSIIGYFTLFAGLGIASYATREGTKYRNDRDELSRFAKEVLLINIISTVISYIALFIVVRVFLNGYMQLLVICSFTIAFTTFSIDWVYQIVEDFAYISIRTVIFQFLSLIALFLFVKSENDYMIYAAITVIANGGNCIFNWFHSKKYIDWKKKCGKLDMKRHIKAIMIIFGITASASIYLNLDSVMVGSIKGDYEVGLYSAATKLTTVVKTMITSISAVMLPRLSYYANHEDNTKYNNLLKRAFNMVLMFAVPSGFGLVILRREIIAIFCGKEFLDASFCSAVLAINMIFSIVDGMMYNQIFLPLKMENRACIATISGAFTNLALNMFIIPIYGFLGAAITTLISEFCVFLILCILASKHMKVSVVYSKIYEYLIAGISIFVIGYLINTFIENSFIKIAVALVFSTLSYFIILFAFKNEYLKDLFGIVTKRIRKQH